MLPRPPWSLTAKTELLPLPGWGNVAHLIAAQAAEIEALRELEEREQRDEALLLESLAALKAEVFRAL